MIAKSKTNRSSNRSAEDEIARQLAKSKLPKRRTDEERLDDYAEKANECHAKAAASVRTAIYAAREAGANLLDAYKLLKHGQKDKWVEANFRGSLATARVYMQIARNWDDLSKTIKQLKSPRLTIDAARKLLRGECDKSVVRETPYANECRRKLSAKSGFDSVKDWITKLADREAIVYAELSDDLDWMPKDRPISYQSRLSCSASRKRKRLDRDDLTDRAKGEYVTILWSRFSNPSKTEVVA